LDEALIIRRRLNEIMIGFASERDISLQTESISVGNLETKFSCVDLSRKKAASEA
jgi:hypothetical protein